MVYKQIIRITLYTEIIMKKIVLLGAGEGLKISCNYLNTSRSYEVVEVWDNKKEGIVFAQGEKTIRKPHKSCGIDYYVITSELYYDELKQGLMENLGIDNKHIKRRNFLLEDVKKDILDIYRESDDPDIISCCEYLQTNDLSDYNFEINEKYFLYDYDIFFDKRIGLFYCIWNGKKMYLKRSLNNERKVKKYLCSLNIEQMRHSPHCYRQEGFEVNGEDIVVDAGAAEGFFALDCIDKVKKIIIIECDIEWIEALQYTFKPYLDKAILIEKRVGKESNDLCVTLDELWCKYNISFVKMDVEGYEEDAVLGARELLKKEAEIKFLVCTYHRKNDYKIISKLFLDNHFMVGASRGYMVFTCEKTEPEFRHGLLLAKKIKK